MTRHAALGALLAIGTFTTLTPLVDLTAAGWAGVLIFRCGARPPWWSLAIAGAVAVSIFQSADPHATAGVAIRILAVATLFTHYARDWKPTDFMLGVAWGLLGQTAALVMLWPLAPARAAGFTANASELTQIGFIAFAVVPPYASSTRWAALATAAITLAASGGRAGIVTAGLWGAGSLSWRRWIDTAIVLAVVAVALVWSGQAARWTDAGDIRAAVEDRIDLVLPDAEPVTGPAQAAVQAAVDLYGVETVYHQATITPTGYGAGAMFRATAAQRPHNWPQVVVFELGALAVIPLVVFGWAVSTGRLPVVPLLAIAPLAMLSEEMMAVPAGHYALAAVLAGMTLQLRRRRQAPTMIHAEPTPAAADSESCTKLPAIIALTNRPAEPAIIAPADR